jgi:uncharacterized protein (DUF3820 family)
MIKNGISNSIYLIFNMTLPFGKHKGQPLILLSNEYVVWLSGFGNTIDNLAETIMLNQDFEVCKRWIKNANVETIDECKNSLISSFRDNVLPDCIVGTENRSWWWVYIHHKEWIYRARDEFKSRHLCSVCLTPLRPIGTSRRNGYKHHDWEGRTMHKQCWKNQL